MPLIYIQIMEGRSQEKIDALLENVTDAVSNSLNAPKENIRIVVTEIPKTHWAIGGINANKLGR